MKAIKKITAFLVMVCLVVPCFPLAVHAAEGTLMFSDPATAVGQEVAVDLKIRSESPIGEVKATITYDATALEFISGVGVTGSGGTLSLTSAGGTAEVSCPLTFRALKEGATAIQVTEYTALLQTNENLTLTLGSAAVTIAPGDGTTPPAAAPVASGSTVTVNGKNYIISGNFTDVDIPEGFTKTTLTFEGAENQVLVQDGSGMYLVYLQGEDAKSAFFIYDPESGKFSPFVKLDISEDAYIMLVEKEGKSTLPSSYVETSLETETGATFPAWQDASKPDYYIVYALNSEGKKGYYQFDKKEGTYQRFTAPKEETAAEAKGILGKITKVVDAHMALVLVVVWAVVLILLVLVIVLGVKLRHRNQELDDIYDEEESEEESILVANKQTANKSNMFKRNVPEEFEEEFEDDFGEDFDDLDLMDVDSINPAKNLNYTQQPPVQKQEAKAKPIRKAQQNSEPRDRVTQPVQRETGRVESGNTGYERFDDEDDFSVDFIDLDD